MKDLFSTLGGNPPHRCKRKSVINDNFEYGHTPENKPIIMASTEWRANGIIAFSSWQFKRRSTVPILWQWKRHKVWTFFAREILGLKTYLISMLLLPIQWQNQSLQHISWWKCNNEKRTVHEYTVSWLIDLGHHAVLQRTEPIISKWLQYIWTVFFEAYALDIKPTQEQLCQKCICCHILWMLSALPEYEYCFVVW